MAAYDLYQVDAFAATIFEGNPAAVIPIGGAWPDDSVLQNIASENNLSETAYIKKLDVGSYHLRWFTPVQEVPLCGHATLASAHILFTELGEQVEKLVFETLSGELTVKQDGGAYVMGFPSDPPVKTTAPDGLGEALGAAPVEVWRGQYLMAVYETEDEVRALAPDMSGLMEVARKGEGLADCVIATAPGGDDDFVSRFFAPSQGIPEDPVTGSAHCVLAPYWADQLGKTELKAFQASARGGAVGCRVLGGRVELRGQAVTYLRGRIVV